MMRRVTFAVLFLAMTVVPGFSQGTVSLVGQVKDEKGQAIPGALVSAKSGSKTVTGVTKFDGKFTLTDLAPGPYELKAVRESYTAATQQITLPASSPVSLTLKSGAPLDKGRLSMADMEKALPDNPYKETLINCQICHSWNGLASQRPHRTADWVNGMKLMQQRGWGRFKDEDIPKMAEYLQAHFGAESTLAPKLPGEPIDERGLNIKYMSFDIPSYHAMPHTAVPDGKGNVWFTEYGAQKIGMLNVKTSKMEEFKIPSKNPPSPHGIALDPSGNVWITEQTAGQLGRFDPKTKTWKEYLIPAPKNPPARPAAAVTASEGATNRPEVSPHTPIADSKGHIWFTAGSNPLMKLNPETGEFTEYVIREGGGGMYGVTYDPKNDRIWYAGIGISEVGYVDPKTGKITHFPMLSPNAGPRRLHVDSKGVAWAALYNVSKLARIDPATGKVTEWDLPGGRDGLPYGFGLDEKERIWVTTYKDDRLHTFDPKTERFVSYPMPTKGNGMRDFYVDENGWIWAGAWGHNQVVAFRLDEAAK